MSTITLVIIGIAVLATAFFIAGYVRGLRNALSSYHVAGEKDALVSQDGHWKSIGLALATSIVVITGMGYSTAFIYAGPLLVLGTTIGVGLAFFIEKRR